MEGNSWHMEQAHKSSRQHMLPRVLLHVIAPPLRINRSMHPASLLRRLLRFNVVHDAAIFRFSHFAHAQLPFFPATHWSHPTGVMYLSATRRIKSRLVKNNAASGVSSGRRNDFNYFAVKLVEKRVVVIKPLAHVKMYFLVDRTNLPPLTAE